MLKITRRAGERIMIGDGIVVTLLEVSGSTARIGVEAPADVRIYREEIWEAVRSENEAAASVSPVLPELPGSSADAGARPDVKVVAPGE